MAIWEGSGNVIALDVLRALTRDPDSTAAFADGAGHDHGAVGAAGRARRAHAALLDEVAGADLVDAQSQARRLSE